MNRILIVEDEITISRLIAVSLRRAGYDCTVANDGSTAADLIAEHDFDLALLDIMLPGLDGYELLGYLRPLGVPVIFITAKGATKDRVRGLQLGADDYIVKPFAMEELLARLRIWSRRSVPLEDPSQLDFGDLCYQPGVRLLKGPEGEEILPKRLAQLMELLLRSAGTPITRSVIFNRIWGPDAEVTDAVIDTYIHLVRQRLIHLHSKVKIINSRGTGYQLQYEAEE